MQAETRIARILLAASSAPHRRPPPADQLSDMLDPFRISRDTVRPAGDARGKYRVQR
jgi:hypothetical protein